MKLWGLFCLLLFSETYAASDWVVAWNSFEGIGAQRNLRLAKEQMEELAKRDIDLLEEGEKPLAQRVLHCLGSLYYDHYDLPKAFLMYERAGLHGFKKLAFFYDKGLGVLKDPEKALMYYQRNVGSFSGRFHQARLLNQQGHKEEAIGLYRSLLREKPDYKSAQFNLSILTGEEIEDPSTLMNHLLVQALQKRRGVSSSIPFIDPRVHMTTTQRLHDQSKSAKPPLMEEGKELEAMFLFQRDIKLPIGRMDYFFYDPYASLYRPHYTDTRDSSFFWRTVFESYSLESPKIRSMVYYNEEGLALLEELTKDASPLVQKALVPIEFLLREHPECLLKSLHIRSTTKEWRQDLANALFVSTLIEHVQSFEERHPLVLWQGVEALLWEMVYHHVPEGQGLGIGLSKVITHTKRKLLERVVEGHPDRLLKKHTLYTTLGPWIDLIDHEDVPLLRAQQAPLEDKALIRRFAIELFKQDKEDALYPRYTIKGLVQMMKQALFNPYDDNITAEKLIEVAMVDEELRSHYYHALFMEQKGTEYFDPFAEDSQSDDPRSLIFEEKALETILRRFGYGEDL